MAPRVFWRRLTALLIDLTLVSVLSTVLVLPFLGDTNKVRLSGGLVRITQCNTVNSLPQPTLDLVSVKVDAATVCSIRPYGIDNGLTLTMVYGRVQTEHTSSQKTYSVMIDEQGLVVWPMAPDALVCLLLAGLGFPLALRRWGKTPGKHVMGLILSRPVSFGPAFLREALRLWPLHFSNLGTLAVPVVGPKMLKILSSIGLGALFGLMGLMFLLFFASHVLPVLRWRGLMPWDRAIGTRLVRKRDLAFEG